MGKTNQTWVCGKDKEISTLVERIWMSNPRDTLGLDKQIPTTRVKISFSPILARKKQKKILSFPRER